MLMLGRRRVGSLASGEYLNAILLLDDSVSILDVSDIRALKVDLEM